MFRSKTFPTLFLMLLTVLPLILAAQQRAVPPDSLVQKSDEYFAELAAKEMLLEDEATQAYLDSLIVSIGQKNGVATDSFEVFILSSIDINASMFPNRHILVTSGMLLKMTNEAELAYILCHELSHYLLAHVAGNRYGDGELSRLEQAKIDVDDEYAADSLGYRLYLGAGYSKASAIVALSKIPAEISVLWLFNGLKYFKVKGVEYRTHPRTANRMERLRNMEEGSSSAPASFIGASVYSQKLKYVRNSVRWDILLDEATRDNYAIQVKIIDSILVTLETDTNAAAYPGYLKLQQSDAIYTLLSMTNPELQAWLKSANVYFDYRITTSQDEEKLSSIVNALKVDKDQLALERENLANKLLANLDFLSAQADYEAEAFRLRGLYYYQQKKYAEAKVALEKYFAFNPSHPRRRYARNLLKKIN